MRRATTEHVLLRAIVVASTLGSAAAQSCTASGSAFVQEGYDFSGVTETAVTIAGFDVTGIKCAAGYATSTGGRAATAIVCDGANEAYTAIGCLPCTAGVGLCGPTSSSPNQVSGDLIHYHDSGVTSTEINWRAPNSGMSASPILGYKIQMKQLCEADVAGTSVADEDSNRIDYLQSAVYDCAGTYQNGFTEPVVATAGSTSLGSWADVSGVYTPTSGQNHDAACHTSCATTACSSWANDAAILHTTSGCSGCPPRNPQTDAGCFPGAAGYPSAVGVVHRIGGLTSNKYYAFRIAAFNHFGTGAWSTQSYAVHTHSAPTAPTWAASPVTAVAAAGTGLTLNWAAGGAYGTGTDECLGRDGLTGTFGASLVLSTPDAGRVISDVDDYYNGMVITTSTDGGESRVIADYIGSTRTVVLSSAFTTADPSGATFTIGPAHKMTATLSCSRSKAEIFAECDTDHNAALSTAEVTACTCVSAEGDGSATGVTYALESCSTAGYGASDSGSETDSGTHTYTIQQCSGSSCAPTITRYTTTSTTQAVTGLTAGTTYVFKVTVTNAAGSTSSQTTTYTTPGLPDTPDPPVALTIEGSEIKLSWVASIDKIVSSVSGHDTVGPANNGFMLYAQSYDVVTSTWVAAVRGSLTHDGEDQIAAAEYAQGRSSSATNPNVAYGSDSGSTVTDDGYLQLAYFTNEYYTNAAGAETAKPSSGSWTQRGLSNRVNVVDTVVVPALMAGTRYRFKVALVNAAGTSALSEDSEEYTTPDTAISSVRIYSGPPCAYKPGQGGATTFAASAEGSNVKYSWELVVQASTGQSTLYSDATRRPGGSRIGTCLDGSTCSVMEYTLPYPGDDSSYHASYDEIKLRVLASNGRGIVAEEIAFGYDSSQSQITGMNTIEYCGCTDPGDDMYWPEATYMVPSLCTTDTFDSADASSVGSSNVASGDWEYFQFFFDADSYSAEVTVRVDVGTVDVFVSTTEIPDANLPHTFSASETGVSNFYVASLSYAELSASTQRSVFVAVNGAAGFSRFQVLGRSSEFQLAPGSDSPSAATRERLQDISSSPTGITKTVVSSGWNFFEFYYPHSDNDIDVQITITSSTAAADGLLDVYASLTERYPSPERATSSSSGYWTGTGHSKTDVSSAAVATMTFTIRPTSHTGRDGALHVGVNGKAPSGWSVGDELTSSTYTITAKVFRYTIASSLLDPVAGPAVSSVSTGTTVAGSIGAACSAPCTAPTLSSSSSSVDDFYVGMVLAIDNVAQTGTMSAPLTLQGSNSHATTLNYYKDWTIATSLPSGAGTITSSSAADPSVLTVSWNSATVTTTASTTYTLTPPDSQKSQSMTVTDYVGATKVATVSEGFTIPVTTASTFSIRITGTDAVARTAAAEDRYAVASTDNFNYYEIATSDLTKSLTLSLTVHYGTAQLFTSTTSLPTQDQTVSTLLGTYAASPSAESISVAASSTNIEGKYVYLGVFGSGGEASYDLVVTENTFGVAAPTQLYWCDEGTDVRSYTTSTVAVDAACTTLPGALYPVCDDDGTPSTVACPLCTEASATLTGTFGASLVLDTPDANGRVISDVDDYYNGMVITTSTDGGESRVITDYTGSTRTVVLSSAFTTADPSGATFTINTGTCEPSACKCSAGNTMGADTFTTLADNNDAGHFFALYLGTEDAHMQTASRSGTGSLPSDISGSSSGWGLDWTMPMTTTWIDSKTDEWDMDVDISFARGGLQTGAGQSFRVFASTRERYPSDERAYDAAVATASVHYDAESMYSQAGLQGKGFATSDTGACTLLKAQSTAGTYGLCLAACDALAGKQTGTFAVAGGAVSLPAGVATSENYYAGWTVVTASSVGTIRTSTQTSTSDTTPVVTFSWLPAGSSIVAGGTTYAGNSATPSISSTSTYTLYPPSSSSTSCNAAQFTLTGTVCQLFSCPSNAASYLVAGASTDQTYLKSTDGGSLVVPMYTFSGKWVYINIQNSDALTGHLQITQTEKTSGRGVSADPGSSATRCTSAFCNYNGNCIDDSTDGEHKTPYCICSDGYSGADCSIEAFSSATTISTSASFVGTVATGYTWNGACATGHTWNGACATGHTWNDASKTCKRYSGPDPHEWEPFVYIGLGYLQHCSPIENLVPGTAAVDDCRALCGYAGLRLVETGTMSAALTLAGSGSHTLFANYYTGWTITITAGAAIGRTGVITSSSTADGPMIAADWEGTTAVTTDSSSEYTLTPPETNSACNAFVHDGAATECKLYTCPTGSAPATTAAATAEGSWGADATALKKAYHRAPLTCCASIVDNVATDGLTCANPVPGYYDRASCETVVGVTTAGTCEQSAATSRAACEDAPTTTVEATCELKPFDEVSDAGCSPAAIRAGQDGSSTANSCDAYDVVKLDCSTQKCTPSPSTANPYKIGYVSCVGGVCTINAPKPIVEVPFTVSGLPEYSKVLAYVDSKPYPSKGANALHYTNNCESSDTLCVSSTSTPSFVDSSIKIYDLQPLPTGKKHTLVLMLLTSEGEPLGTVLKQFEVGYAGGCAVAPDGSVCGNQGACHLGYCVCYDGYFGTDCGRNIDEDGSVCAAQSSTTETLCVNADGNGATPGFGNYQCNWDADTALCSIQVVTTGFTAGGVYQARQTQLANSKLGEARFLNTRMLEANAAEIKQSDNAIASGTSGTKTKLETVAASVVATVAASKTATQTSVDALYAKAERNAIKVQQAKEESLRLQTTNLEAKLEMQRSLADHQTQVQNRFQSKRFDVYKLNAQKQDKLKQEFARTRFTLNQLLTSNGPTVDPTKFKQSTCTTDQFYNVVCSESTVDQSASFAGTGYVSGQTVDTANTDGTRAAPVVAIEGEDTVGHYDDVNRGR